MARLASFVICPGVDSRTLALTGYTDYEVMSDLQRLFQTSKAMPANIGLVGITPVIYSNMLVSLVAYVSKLEFPIGSGQELFPGLKRYFESNLDNPLGRMEVEFKTNFIMMSMALALGFQKAMQLAPVAVASSSGFVWKTVFTYVATCFVLKHLSMEIDEYGLGNGVTFLLAVNIMSGILQSFESIRQLISGGLLPLGDQLLFAATLGGLVIGSVVASKVEFQFRMGFYDDPGGGTGAPSSEPLPTREIRLTLGRLQVLEKPDKSRVDALAVSAFPSGVQPLLTAGLLVGAGQQLILRVLPGLGNGLIFNMVFVSLFIGLLAFAFNFAAGLSRGESTAKALNAMKSKLVGVPPGAGTEWRIKGLYTRAATLGGMAIALMAIVANAFDTYFLFKYNIYAGSTGLLLVTNLFTSVARKIEGIRVRNQGRSRYLKERSLIPANMPIVGPVK